MLKTLIAAAIVLMPVAALAVEVPRAECGLSDDKASIVVTASNPGKEAYKCSAWCRANVTGQRAFERFDCSFNLAPGAAEKAVCTRKGGAPDFFSAIGPSQFTCSPR